MRHGALERTGQPGRAAHGGPARLPPAPGHAPRPPAERRAEIMAAARALYEEQGPLAAPPSRTSRTAMGVTRSLFYHYFPDKEAVTYGGARRLRGGLPGGDATTGTRNRRPGDIEQRARRASCSSCGVGAVRARRVPRSSLASQRERGALPRVREPRGRPDVASYLVESDGARLRVRCHEVRIEHRLRDVLRAHPGRSWATCARIPTPSDAGWWQDLIAQTLHMDRGRRLTFPPPSGGEGWLSSAAAA